LRASNSRLAFILLVTHEHALARELADEIWTLDAGKIAHKTQRER